jgi:hypothetical protein
LIAKAISDFSRYGEPLAEELRSKSIALSRQLSRAAYSDGTGVIATAASADFSDPNKMVVTLDDSTSARGFIGWAELGDRHVSTKQDGTPTAYGNPVAYWEVENRERETPSITYVAKDASGATIAHGGAGDFAAQEVFYRTTQKSYPDLTALTADYQTLSEEWAGLESLSQNDGRTVNNITLTGALGGTRRDAKGNPIDSQDFQQLMSQVMIAVGQGRYKYSMAMMAWETLDALIESREVDRRFQSVKDNRRGVESFGYKHGKNDIVFEADEFCQKQRIYCLPEGDVLQFYGKDFEFVNPEGKGQKFFLKPNGSGHDRTVRAYMEGGGTLKSVHNAAIGVIKNFTI